MNASGRWIAFLLWTVVIFTLVPVATVLRQWIVDRLGARALFWAMLALLAAAVVASVRWLWARRRERAGRRLAWILAIALVIGGWGWHFRLEAEPAHFVSFAILGVLAFRALQPRIRDRGIYPAAAALTAIVGILDEILQWLVPGRYWDLRDVAINAGIGALVQLLIWKGFEPEGARPPLSPRSLRAALRWLAAAAVLLLLCLSNTPGRTAWLADHVPGLAYLGAERSTRMIDYGHLIVDRELGRFASRLSREEIARTDRERGVEAARILDRYRHPRQHAELRRLYPPWRDAFVYELREHLSARDRAQARAFRKDQDPAEARRAATASYREHRILERYFPRALAAFGAELQPGIRERLEKLHDEGADYTSEVGAELVTSYGEAQARAVLLAVLVALVCGDYYCGHRIAAGSARL